MLKLNYTESQRKAILLKFSYQILEIQVHDIVIHVPINTFNNGI